MRLHHVDILAVVVAVASIACVRVVTPATSFDGGIAVDDARGDTASDRTHESDRFDAVSSRDPSDARDQLDALVRTDVSDVVDRVAIEPTEPLTPVSCIPEDADLGGGFDASTDGDLRVLDTSHAFDPASCPWPLSPPLTSNSYLSRTGEGVMPCDADAGARCVRRVFPFALRERAVVSCDGSEGFPTMSIRTRCDDPATGIYLHRTSVGDLGLTRGEAIVDPGQYFLVMESPYPIATCRITFAPAAENYGCDRPTAAPPCTPIPAPAGIGRTYMFESCDGDDYWERIISYRVDVPADHLLRVVGGSVHGCGFAEQVDPYLGPFSERSVVVGIRGRRETMYFEPVPLAANRECASAARLTPGAELHQNTALAGRVIGRCSRSREALHYVVDVPARTTGRVLMRGRVDIDIGDACETLVPTTRSTSLFAITNDEDRPARAVIAASSSPGTEFDIGVDLLARPDAATNSWCETPIDLEPGVARRGETFLRAFGSCRMCNQPFLPALFYRVHLEPGRHGHVETSEGLSAMGPIRCDGSVTASEITTGLPRIDLANESSAPIDYEFAIVARYRPEPTAPFDLEWIEE